MSDDKPFFTPEDFITSPLRFLSSPEAAQIANAKVTSLIKKISALEKGIEYQFKRSETRDEISDFYLQIIDRYRSALGRISKLSPVNKISIIASRALKLCGEIAREALGEE